MHGKTLLWYLDAKVETALPTSYGPQVKNFARHGLYGDVQEQKRFLRENFDGETLRL
jgi:hypothetical protein